MEKVVFLDRDGVINHDSPDFIKSWDEFQFIPGAPEAIANLTIQGFKIIIISNQSGISLGKLSYETAEDIFFKMQRMLGQLGGCITDVYFCPHDKHEWCECRKPRPGMILRAKADHLIYDSALTFMVGDRIVDIQTGLNANVSCNILVGNNYDKEELQKT